MPKYTKRKDGRLQTSITVDGKRVYFYADTNREMQQKLLEYQKKADEGPMFEEVADDWWTKKEPTIARNSLRNYTPAVRRAIDRFSGTRIREITSADIDAFVQEFGLTHAAKTTATQLNVMNQIMKYARMKRYTDSVPTDIVEVPRGLKRTKRLLPPECDVEAAKQNLGYPIMGLFAYVLLYSGLRRGEALALQYKDFDYNSKRIIVEKSLCAYRNDPFIKYPKTDAGCRTVPLVDALIAVIPKGKPDEYLFLRDGHFITDADFDTLWGWYCRDTGITSTPHQMRHWFATLLYDAGIDKMEAARYMGHTTAQMTEIYTHITQSRTSSSLDRLNQKISEK